jgi:hypothetical protein
MESNIVAEELNLVSEFINHDNGPWKIENVRSNFITPEADAILNIPLRRNGGDDFWAWSLEKADVYSKKSAYRALMSHNEYLALDKETMMKSTTTEKRMWFVLWKLNVMPKVHVFLWGGVLRGILPVENIQKHRHISPLGRWKLCLGANEDIMHALIACDHAQKFWVEAQCWLDFSLP